MALELSYAIYKGKRNYYRANDAFTSIAAGLLQQTMKYNIICYTVGSTNFCLFQSFTCQTL